MGIGTTRQRTLLSPQPLHRDGCPCVMTPVLREVVTDPNVRRPLQNEFTTLTFQHISKTGALKNEFSLAPLHQELELASLQLAGTGSSNIVFAKLSFDCKITTKTGEVFRKYIDFDLKIPGANTMEDGGAFSYDFLEQLYGDKVNFYGLLEKFYAKGRAEVNPADHKHGVCPIYDGTKGGHDQYIRHTEQHLVAYLASEEGAQMLINRLRATIRREYLDAQAAKVYHIGLHLHSTKTCCSPCEYALIGLMTPGREVVHGTRRCGLLQNFQRLGSLPSEQLTFSFPKKSLFRLITTVTASTNDAHHKAQPKYSERALNVRISPKYIIPTKDPAVSKRIYTSYVESEWDIRREKENAHLEDKTIAISGSQASSGSPGTIGACARRKEEEGEKEMGVVRSLLEEMNLA